MLRSRFRPRLKFKSNFQYRNDIIAEEMRLSGLEPKLYSLYKSHLRFQPRLKPIMPFDVNRRRKLKSRRSSFYNSRFSTKSRPSLSNNKSRRKITAKLKFRPRNNTAPSKHYYYNLQFKKIKNFKIKPHLPKLFTFVSPLLKTFSQNLFKTIKRKNFNIRMKSTPRSVSINNPSIFIKFSKLKQIARLQKLRNYSKPDKFIKLMRLKNSIKFTEFRKRNILKSLVPDYADSILNSMTPNITNYYNFINRNVLFLPNSKEGLVQDITRVKTSLNAIRFLTMNKSEYYNQKKKYIY